MMGLILFCPTLVGAVLPLPAGENGIGFDISGGITLNSGNSNQTVINGGYNFAYQQNSFGYQSKLELFYGQNDGITQVSNGTWEHSLIHTLNKRLNLSGNLGIEYDRVAQIASRTSMDIGVLYKISQTKKNKASLSATVRGEILNGMGDTEDKTGARLVLGISNEHSFSDTASFKFNCQYTPSIIDPFNDYRLELQSSLSVLMKRPVWLTLKVRERFNSQPLDDVKQNDLTLVTALTLSF